MKTSLFIVLTLAGLVAVALAAEPLPGGPAATTPAAGAPAATSPGAGAFKTDDDKVSYCIGLDIGRTMKRQAVPVNTAVLARGIADALSGGKLLLTEEEQQAVMQAFDQRMTAKQAKEMEAAGAKNLKDGAAFLAENAKKPGVTVLPSGLQYKELKAGAGPTPKATDTVSVNYQGTLLDGTEFDSSYKRGSPATFPVKGVIAGWTEALQLMKVGSKWQLFIPANLAYGEAGAGDGVIAPNSTLVFEVELLSIK